MLVCSCYVQNVLPKLVLEVLYQTTCIRRDQSTIYVLDSQIPGTRTTTKRDVSYCTSLHRPEKIKFFFCATFFVFYFLSFSQIFVLFCFSFSIDFVPFLSFFLYFTLTLVSLSSLYYEVHIR